jgi:hypothetical protein
MARRYLMQHLAHTLSINRTTLTMKAAPYIALAIVGIAFAIASIAASFIEGGFRLHISNPLEITIGVDHKPAPVIHYHIEKKGVWGT